MTFYVCPCLRPAHRSTRASTPGGTKQTTVVLGRQANGHSTQTRPTYALAQLSTATEPPPLRCCQACRCAPAYLPNLPTDLLAYPILHVVCPVPPPHNPHFSKLSSHIVSPQLTSCLTQPGPAPLRKTFLARRGSVRPPTLVGVLSSHYPTRRLWKPHAHQLGEKTPLKCEERGDSPEQAWSAVVGRPETRGRLGTRNICPI